MNQKDISIKSDSAIDNPAVDPFYSLYLEERYGGAVYIPQEYEIIYSSISELDPGYTYLQPDGTKVAAILLWAEEYKSEVEVSFKVPLSVFDELSFYGQPGVNDPTVSLGNGVRFSGSTGKIANNPKEIQKGLKLNLY